MDQIRWINHAGFELKTAGIKLVCDPWLTGQAFNDSWALISESKYTPNDFQDVDFIWLSHEHPDHFSPRDLQSIAASDRSRITVLIQKTADGRVRKFCERLDFKVREIADWERVQIAQDVHLTLHIVGDDSLCLIETPNGRYLNINDCVVSDTTALHTEVQRRLGSPDVLMTQFSFANWAGNPGDPSIAALAKDKLDQVETQLRIYQPKTFIPFASFVWFCRHDNFHLNAASNKIADVFTRFATTTDCVILYPGDVYTLGESHDSTLAIERYTEDESSHVAPLDLHDTSYSPTALEALATEHAKRIRRQNWLWTFLPLRITGYIRPVSIYLTDLGQALHYSMFSGLRWASIPRDKTDIEFTSAAFAQMLRYGTGYDTLYISGRFTQRNPSGHIDLSRNFVVLRRNDDGQFFPSVFFDLEKIRTRLKYQLTVSL